ncbi:hypothetical protein [Rubrivirga sp.]|uniref:hypothetical protein n=1 Tax=Rubrivirga sp. TaxID=1885344 RepID=UPI003C76331E
MRPRFESVAPCPALAAPGRLRAALDAADAPCRGEVYGNHAVLHVPRAQERVWSPFLSLDLVGHPEGTLVRGLFGPKPSIWSLFAASYAVCAFGAVFAAGFAFVQWTLGQPPWALWVLLATALGALATYAFARAGQRRGRGQMDLLQGFLEDALATP